MPIARVVFDESHSQAWTIRPEVARAMQPSHPEDSSYALAADALHRHGFAADAHADGELPLADAAVLVVAHPSEPQWERTIPGGGSPWFGDRELDAIEEFVLRGGGLVVLAEEEQAKYGNNLADLAARFGIEIASDVVSDYERHDRAPHWVLGEPAPRRGAGGVDLLTGVDNACFYRATTLGGGDAVLRTSPSASAPHASLLAVTEHGAGRVVVAADSDLFGDDCIGDHDHEQLWVNLIHWAAGPALARPAARPRSAAAEDSHWHALRDATDELRLLQEPDGSTAHDVGEHVKRIVAALHGLAPRLPHQAEYLDAVVADLRAWRPGEPPDFTRALDAFRPDRHREDGIEHLVVFPMYLQNASRDRRFESLI